MAFLNTIFCDVI